MRACAGRSARYDRLPTELSLPLRVWVFPPFASTAHGQSRLGRSADTRPCHLLPMLTGPPHSGRSHPSPEQDGNLVAIADDYELVMLQAACKMESFPPLLVLS